MIGKIFALICIVSTIYAAVYGNMQSLSASVIDGATKAVELSVSLCGAMCLWSGVMEVLRMSGAVNKLSRLLRPLLRVIFPTASRDENASGAIAASLAANLLGIGNAATPLALGAMRAIDEAESRQSAVSPPKKTVSDVQSAGSIKGQATAKDCEKFIQRSASNDMITFAVLGTASLDIVPTTLIALRTAAGSADPFDILIPVWIASAASAALAVLLCRMFAAISKPH